MHNEESNGIPFPRNIAMSYHEELISKLVEAVFNYRVDDVCKYRQIILRIMDGSEKS